MKKLFFLPLFLVLAACQTNSMDGLETVDASEAAELETSLDSGKALVFGDVYYEDNRCGGSSFVMINEETKETWGITNGSVKILMQKDTAPVKPGTYRITNVRCGQSSVAIGGSWTDALLGKDKLKKLFAPRFTVEAGEVLHVGTLRINIIKKKTWLDDARVIVTREATTPEAKQRTEAALANLDRPIQFTTSGD
ncbi:hypothetical protein FMN50_06420 [Rhodobacterales bacterium]|nr:hypothetical protein FMN50_06420 [Rhodobacterales bacterium]